MNDKISISLSELTNKWMSTLGMGAGQLGAHGQVCFKDQVLVWVLSKRSSFLPEDILPDKWNTQCMFPVVCFVRLDATLSLSPRLIFAWSRLVWQSSRSLFPSFCFLSHSVREPIFIWNLGGSFLLSDTFQMYRWKPSYSFPILYFRFPTSGRPYTLSPLWRKDNISHFIAFRLIKMHGAK